MCLQCVATQRAFEEYGEFQDKLDLEKDLRNKAEEYAQEVLQDNRKLIEQLKEAGATIPAGSHQVKHRLHRCIVYTG